MNIKSHALCRGDVSAIVCRRCVVIAYNTLIHTHCPDSRSAIIWREHCMVKYSDIYFFGKVDTNNGFFNVTDEDTWNSETEVLFFASMVAFNAINSTKFYANSTLNLTEVTFYGVAQCTQDLVKDDCKKCLDEARSQLKVCCWRYKGVRFEFGSCNLRYEIYPFLN
ncbi:hypothetical protein CASFOL_040884 [Castilleja foliolosa]|uniref:Gnk2-homologous domain-containing protein n=1 Tax=Castilleja foliolosa TaxID=1961234 RepID=A0ABD3BCW2_9LAMI